MSSTVQDSPPASSASTNSSPEPSFLSKLSNTIETAPCFRVPLMWGIACGLAAGLHKFRVHRASPQAIMNACDFAVLGMGVSTSLGWWMCMRNRRQEEEEIGKMMAVQGFKPMTELEKEEQKSKK
ncbi:Hypothetical protein NocV09_00303250 [Nannochloropsis oceanica]